MVKKNKVLLVISGSIAAYKCLDLIRMLRKDGHDVVCVLSGSATEFITPLSVASLSGNKVYTDLFLLEDDAHMAHIQLSRDADVVLVAPASANIIAKMALGQADDLASTVLMACDKRIIVAPAMNKYMWNNKALQRNVNILLEDGVVIVEPQEGELACGEIGEGKMADIEEIAAVVVKYGK